MMLLISKLLTQNPERPRKTCSSPLSIMPQAYRLPPGYSIHFLDYCSAQSLPVPR